MESVSLRKVKNRIIQVIYTSYPVFQLTSHTIHQHLFSQRQQATPYTLPFIYNSLPFMQNIHTNELHKTMTIDHLVSNNL